MSKQLVELTPDHHWFKQYEVDDDFVIKTGYNATFLLQPADGQHPYFDTDKQEWTDEPEKVAVPDKDQQLSMWLAQQVTALTSKVNSLELKASSQSSAAPTSQSQTSSEPASQTSSTSEGSAN